MEEALRFDPDGEPRLLREQHVAFLMKAFTTSLPGSYVSLDASRTWLVYWTVQSLALLDVELPEDIKERVIGACFVA